MNERPHSRPPARRAASVAAALMVGVLGAGAMLGRPPVPSLRSIVVGTLPTALALDPGGDLAFVADEGDASISVLDLRAGRVVRTVAAGTPGAVAPLALALDSRAHRLFAANRGDTGAASVVCVLDSRTGGPVATVQVGPGAAAIAVDEPRGRVLVANEEAGTVSVLDARSGRLLRTVGVGAAPVALAVDERAARAFVASATVPMGPYYGPGWVSVLDTRRDAVLRTVPVGRGPGGIVLDARTAHVFVANVGDDTVSVLDARAGTVVRTVAVGEQPTALAVDTRRARIFVANAGDGTVSVLDARSGAVQRTIQVAPGADALSTPPYAIAVDEVRDRVYVTAWGRLDQDGLPLGSGTLSVLDARSGAVRQVIAVGVAPRAVAVEGNSGRVVAVGGAVIAGASDGWDASWLGRLRSWLPWLDRIAPRPPATVRMAGSVSVLDPAGP